MAEDGGSVVNCSQLLVEIPDGILNSLTTPNIKDQNLSKVVQKISEADNAIKELADSNAAKDVSGLPYLPKVQAFEDQWTEVKQKICDYLKDRGLCESEVKNQMATLLSNPTTEGETFTVAELKECAKNFNTKPPWGR